MYVRFKEEKNIRMRWNSNAETIPECPDSVFMARKK